MCWDTGGFRRWREQHKDVAAFFQGTQCVRQICDSYNSRRPDVNEIIFIDEDTITPEEWEDLTEGDDTDE